MRLSVAIIFASLALSCSSDPFPKTSASAKWVDETDAKFEALTDQMIVALKSQPEKWKGLIGTNSEADARADLLNELGNSFMGALQRNLPDADFQILRGIISRKKADDKWLTAHLDSLNTNRAQEILLFPVRIGAVKARAK